MTVAESLHDSKQNASCGEPFLWSPATRRLMHAWNYECARRHRTGPQAALPVATQNAGLARGQTREHKTVSVGSALRAATRSGGGHRLELRVVRGTGGTASTAATAAANAKNHEAESGERKDNATHGNGSRTDGREGRGDVRAGKYRNPEKSTRPFGKSLKFCPAEFSKRNPQTRAFLTQRQPARRLVPTRPRSQDRW